MKISENIKAYHGNSAISRSRLMKIAESPEKFRYIMDNPEQPTESLLLGQTVHKLVLEPQGFDAEFAIEPIVNKRTNAGKDALAEFYFYNPQKTIITPKTYETAKAIADAVLSNPKAKALLTGDIEKSYYWTDEITGEAVKCRPDVTKTIKGKGLIVDLKTCANADTETFARESIKYGYDVQVAMCKIGVEKETGIDHSVVYVCVEKEPPYAINILQADELVIEYGTRRYREFLGIYHECKENERWYGYLGFADEINRLSLPAYLLKELQ